tara:strand:+ start:1782 stop:4196 length:2415 start_codon:yes stop_codon:yes gene_type:complete
MWLGPPVKVPAFVAAWAAYPEVVKEALANLDDVRCIITPKPLRQLLNKIATSAHYSSRSVSIDVVGIQSVEEGSMEYDVIQRMSHRNCSVASAVKKMRGENVPIANGRTCLVSQRRFIQHRLDSGGGGLDLAELFNPSIVQIRLGLRNDVARGQRGINGLEEQWVDQFMEIMVPEYNVALQRITSTARGVYGNIPSYSYTASRFLSNVETATLSRSAEADQPAGLTLELRPYQKKTLQFCLRRETSDEDILMWKNVCEQLWWSPVLRRFCVSDAPVDTTVRGGIVAEEMGMGKTLIALALTLSNPIPDAWEGGQTIVVCPVALVSQWAQEAARCLEAPGRIYVYHGSSRRRNTEFLKQCNIVVTTYGILTRDEVLHEIHWHRVVFDESHVARRPTTQRFKACVRLRACNRWAVTGTPLVNGSVGELYSQLRLAKPDVTVSVPQLSWASTHFMYLLAHTITRHTKSMRVNGVPILDLPMMRREDVLVPMSDSLALRYRQDVRSIGQVCRANNSMTRIMVSVDRLRRRCSSGIATENVLAPSSSQAMNEEERMHATQKMQEDMCPICLEPISAVALIRQCKHIFCSTCIAEHLNRCGSACPMCRGRFTFESLRYMPVPQQTDAAVPDFNAKIDRCVGEVLSAPSDDKFIVFSNFRLTLGRVAAALTQSSVQFRDLSMKSLSARRRHNIMEEFSTHAEVRVLLLPMRSTSVGLNITAANRCILMEPCLNPALEKQAIGRCWRMGQQREIRVQRFVVENTIEQKIVQANRDMDGVVRDGTGSERALVCDRDRVRWGFSRISSLLQSSR